MKSCDKCNELKPKKCAIHIFMRPYQDVDSNILIRDIANFINEIEHTKAKVYRMRQEMDLRTNEMKEKA